jgi:hypothetical protein
LSEFLYEVTRSVRFKGTLGSFSNPAEVQSLKDNLCAYKNRVGSEFLTQIKLDPNLWGSGASGYTLACVSAVGGAIDVMIAALGKISSEAGLFGVLGLKFWKHVLLKGVRRRPKLFARQTFGLIWGKNFLTVCPDLGRRLTMKIVMKKTLLQWTS